MAKQEEIQRKWYLIDAQDKVLGRLATEVARILRGKHKPTFTPNVDTGDHVIVVNADKVKVSGNKFEDKLYYRHSGYPGGLKVKNFATLHRVKPELIIEKAVWGMIPHNRLGRSMIKKLRVYRGPHHPHDAQNPEVWEMD
jgi:large subunit ribosomal protein L13